MDINQNTSLNEITETYPEALQILGDMGFDTCCGGWEAVGTAAANLGIPWEQVSKALEPVVKGA